MEEWRKIPGFNNYEVSSTGKVRSYYSTRPQYPLMEVPTELKISTHRLGYKFVKMINNSKKRKQVFVHRAVAMAFVAGDFSLEVAHLDGTRNNNIPSNLAWVTHKENISHMKIHGTNKRPPGEKNHQSKLKDYEVKEIKKELTRDAKHSSLAKKYGVSRAAIWSIYKGKTWTHV